MEKLLCGAAVSIVCSEQNPVCIAGEVKTDDYFMHGFCGAFNLLGGQFAGPEARSDQNPRDTLVREVREELQINKEAKKLVLPEWVPEELAVFREAVCSRATHFGDYICTIDARYRDRGGYKFLASCYVSQLNYREWLAGMRAQDFLKNMSCESQTLITSLPEMIEKSQKTAFGYDRVLQRFWLDMGLAQAEKLPLMEGNDAELIGTTPLTWKEYLELYDVERKP